MIVLDTNILSELMRQVPDPYVVRWIDSCPESELFLTAITIAEILYGIERLPSGKRKSVLAAAMESMLAEDFAGRVLAFEAAAAAHYAKVAAAREHAGHAISMADAQIAAICLQHSAELATRNVKDFGNIGVRLRNPFNP